MRIALFTIFSLFFLPFSFSQSLLEQKKEYTRADTLRGALRPERTCYDVTYYHLKLKIDTTGKTIAGSNKIEFTTIEDFRTLQIDLFDNMKVVNITSGGQELKYRREFNAIFVDMNRDMKAGERGEITVNYHGQPIIAKRAPWDGGFSWSYDKNGKSWIGVSCEGIGASLWWPCKDHLSDEPDSMRIACTIPEGLMCVANGQDEGVVNHSDKTNTFNWFVSYPINNYNVTLNIGDYSHLHDEYIAEDGSKLDLDYYVLSYNTDKAKKHFTQVAPMMKCYEKYLGKYPFWNDGFAMVETPYLGMEHQGAIAYGNKYLTGYLGMDYSRMGLKFDYIIIHEAGHEWWGNSVSCRDIADMWIHEGFCTYAEAIYVECLYDYSTALRYINAKKNTVGNKHPVAGNYDVNEEGDGDMYSKGSLFLNTLRHITCQGNDPKWWSIIKTMSDTTFKMKNISYQDVVNYFNTATGTRLDEIFEQYLRHSDIPVLEYKIKKIKKGEYELRYRWQTDVANFAMPFFYTTGQSGYTRAQGTNEWQTLRLPMSSDKDFLINEMWTYIRVKKM